MSHSRPVPPVRAFVLALVALVAFAGCNPQEMLDRLAPKSADARAREYLLLLANGQVDSAFGRLSPPLQSPQAEAGLRQLATMLAKRSLDSMQRIGVQVNDIDGTRHVNLSYQFHDSLGWFMANVATVGPRNQVAGDGMVEGVSMRPIPASLETLTKFTLAGRGARHWLWLAATVVTLLVSLATALHVVMTRGMPRRWLWTLVALVGIGRFSLDWSTGDWAFLPLQFLLFSAAAMRAGPVAPWIISFAVPVGAAFAEWKRRQWMRRPPPIHESPSAIDHAVPER